MTFLTLVIALVLPRVSLAQDRPDPTRVDLLPVAAESALAVSAAPKHLQSGATVYALTADGFAKVQDGGNGFSCVVNRDHPLNRKPVCYDAEGSRTILPKVLHVGELMVKGVPLAEIEREVAEGFRTGRYLSPARPGVAYMLSSGIRVYDPQAGTFGTFPPHMMFYAPNLTNDDIGWTAEGARATPGLPFIGYQGPHGFMIVIVSGSR